MFVVEAGVEQMVGERKEYSDNEGHDHQSRGSPVNLSHRRGQLRLWAEAALLCRSILFRMLLREFGDARSGKIKEIMKCRGLNCIH